MKCEEAAEWFGVYRDLPADSEERLAVDLHVRDCPNCAEEFRIWEESAELILELPADDVETDSPYSPQWVNQNVMTRIYAEQSWYLPAVRRTYSFSYTFRRNVAAILAGLLALFVCGFLYTSFDRADRDVSGVVDTASAFASSRSFSNSVHLEVPVASLSDPIMLHVNPVMPEYWVALSMLGMIMTLLILNWLSRVRS